MNLTIDENWLKSTFTDLRDFENLGVGGQKVVIGALHKTEGRVVLKIIHPQTDLEIVRREIRAVQQVQSHRVPKILDFGQASTHLGGCIWIREVRIDGETLRTKLARGPLSPEQVLRLGLHMLEALEKAESAQIVHRDVKPENIICDGSDDFWLLDFGIARHLNLSSLTSTSSLFGKMTIGYAPPEQCRNLKADIDSRADLFALGVTLHECSTGKNFFFDPPPRDVLEIVKRVERWILPPLMLPINSKDGFGDLISSLTQKNRIHRPRTVAQALTWLQEICIAEGILDPS